MSKKENGFYLVKADCNNCKVNEQEIKLKRGVSVADGLKDAKCGNCGCSELSRHYEKSCGCIHWHYTQPTFPQRIYPTWEWKPSISPYYSNIGGLTYGSSSGTLQYNLGQRATSSNVNYSSLSNALVSLTGNSN